MTLSSIIDSTTPSKSHPWTIDSLYEGRNVRVYLLNEKYSSITALITSFELNNDRTAIVVHSQKDGLFVKSPIQNPSINFEIYKKNNYLILSKNYQKYILPYKSKDLFPCKLFSDSLRKKVLEASKMRYLEFKKESNKKTGPFFYPQPQQAANEYVRAVHEKQDALFEEIFESLREGFEGFYFKSQKLHFTDLPPRMWPTYFLQKINALRTIPF